MSSKGHHTSNSFGMDLSIRTNFAVPAFFDAIHVVMPANEPALTGQSLLVLDIRSLAHRIPWQGMAMTYTQVVHQLRHEKLRACRCCVRREPGRTFFTKDSFHVLRCGGRAGPTVYFKGVMTTICCSAMTVYSK